MAFAAPAERATARPLQVAAAVIGNALEWYDFIVFGILTVIIAKLFFPTGTQYASLLLTTATFGVGFFMRPVGGVLLGIYADRKGRKPALLLIVGLMTVAMAMIAFAPTYAAIGAAAPLTITLARLLQGFATGGEFGSSTAFLIETAPPERRGYFGSWQMAGQGIAALLGALLGALVTRSLSPEALYSWGWRIPFLFGLVIGPVGLFIRRYVNESQPFVEARASAAAGESLATTIAKHLREVLASMGLVTAATISMYVIVLYMPTFARTQLHLPLDQAFIAQSIALVCAVVLIPLFGALSDRIGRKPLMIGALVPYLLLSYPLFSWMHSNPSFAKLVIAQTVFCCLLACFYGPLSTAIAEQFAVRARSIGLGIAYNVAVMIFGGFAQFFVTWLIEVTGSPLAPSFYVMFGAALGLVSAFALAEGAFNHLPKALAAPRTPNE